MAHLVTGYAGKAHIKSADDGAYNAAFFGAGQYVIESGNDNCFAGSIIDNNTVRILDGEGLMYGRHFRIEPNTYEDMTIETGTTGMNRIDLICVTYVKNAEDEKENAYLEIIKGAETSGTAAVPKYINGNILKGASKNQMPLYKVIINGVVLSKIEPIFERIYNYKRMSDIYLEKHENLDEKYYKQFEQRIEESVDELTEVPNEVLAQVKINRAKLVALENIGKIVYTMTGTISAQYMTNEVENKNQLLKVPDGTLEDDAEYILRVRPVYTGTYGGGKVSFEEGYVNYTGRILVKLYSGNEYIGGKELNTTQGYSSSHAIDLSFFSKQVKKDTAAQKLSLAFTPFFYKADTGNKLNTKVHLYAQVEIDFIKVNHDLSKITGGVGDIPDFDYSTLDNKPKINGITLEGDLSSADLNLSGGQGYLKQTDVVDNLLSDAEDLPLSAKQGKILNEKVLSCTKDYVIPDGTNCIIQSSSNTWHVEKIGKLVNMYGRIYIANELVADTWYTIGQLPEGFYPIRTHSNMLLSAFNSSYIEGGIATDGSVMIRMKGAALKGWFPLVTTNWFTA